MSQKSIRHPTPESGGDRKPTRGLTRRRWVALLVVLVSMGAVSGSIGIHSAQGVGSRARAELLAARGSASQLIREARTAGVSATLLEGQLRRSEPPDWQATSIGLLLGGGALASQMDKETDSLRADAAKLAPEVRRWAAGMSSIDKVRAETEAQMVAAVKALPSLKGSVAQRAARLSLSGAIPLANQRSALASLTSADIWAGQFALAAEASSSTIAKDRALVQQAAQLKIPLGDAAAQIQQAEAQLLTAGSPTEVQSVMGTLATSLLPLEVAVRAADPGPGQVIVIRLAAQTLTAYLNGTQVLETPVTTGRKGLRTPLGIDTIRWEESPYLFISPWPIGNPYYYPPSEVTWVLHFLSGGYFIHDAPWEPNSAFGPGSQNGPYASHGCVQVPHTAMQFLWGWTKMGATVVIAP